MEEKIKGYLRKWGDDVDLDNIDLENLDWHTMISIKQAKEKRYEIKFQKYDPRDGSLEVIIDRKDLDNKLLPESNEEWEEKRRFYLKNGGKDLKLYCEGCDLGYLNSNEDCVIIQEPSYFYDIHAGNAIHNEDWDLLYKKLDVALRKKHKKEDRKARKNTLFNKISREIGVNLKVLKRKIKNSWEIYEITKEKYARNAESNEQYEKRIEEILEVLKI